MTLVLSVFPSFVAGGAQVRFCSVANHHGRALRHVIVAMDSKVTCRERLDPALNVQVLNLPAAKGTMWGTWCQLSALLGELQPDVLLTHNWGAIDWALANSWPFVGQRVRHVHAEDGFGPDERDRQIPRRVWVRRLALRQTTVALPSLVLMRLAQEIWRLDRHLLRYVPNGVDLARFAPATAPSSSSWTLPGNGPVVGTVAALRPEKNLGRLLRAVAQIPKLRLLIVGDGPERQALIALTEMLGIVNRVVFAGHLPDPASTYAHMDIFALSSDTEQMPLSVLEAMAAGLPVATTAVGDVASMLAGENAPFIVGRDEVALAGALGRLADDAELRRAVGAANRSKAQEYDQASMFAAWGKLLGSCYPTTGTGRFQGNKDPAI
jgi:glycosyltransferase involved in cell wall biosynthesis